MDNHLALHPNSTNLPEKNLDIHRIISEFLEAQDVRENSRKTYERQLRAFILWMTGSGRVLLGAPLKRQDILEYRTYLQQRTKSAFTVNGYMTAVRKLFAWLESEKVCPDVTRGIKGLKKPNGHMKDTLTPDQLRNALDSLDEGVPTGLRDIALFNLMARTGLRDIEVARALVGDVRQEAGQAVLYIQGKGRDSKDEFVLLTDEAIQPLHKYLVTRKVEESAPLFCSGANRNAGGNLTPRSISRIIKGILIGIDIDSKRLSAHSLRHTAITLSILGGATLEQAGAMARHKNIATTQTYWHNLERIKQGAEKFIRF